ncbi:MAG TPA: aminopeptidase family protein P, partial [Alphaproteobacteria bacterium]|nr:aminopeptidase family protein P [Alphaproteobacteria bacterium]
VATILTMPDSVAWLLNIRGADVKCVPYALSTMIVAADGKAHLFIDPAKLSDEVRAHLKGKVALHKPEELESVLSGVMLEGVMKSASKPVLLDSGHAPVYYRHLVEGAGGSVKEFRDPVLGFKAIKTEAEKTAIRAAHVADGVAMVKFLEWLDRDGLNGQQSEISVAETLESFRAEEAAFKDLSFETIAGCGPNGAIVHYRASEETNRPLESGTLLLLDSGAQYYGPAFTGTTDITRTVALGEPSSEMRRHFTLVLKGHIDLAKAQFPAGNKGVQVDVLARTPLWDEGLDFDHGTGHGVGCYLGVHEDAASISKKGEKPLEAGMLLSNEPGYYKAGAYGIRIENLVFVEKRDIHPGSGKDWLGFETITLAPIDRRLIDASLLSRPELEWLNDYHARVRKTLSPLLDEQRKAWLDQATAPIPLP